MVVNEVSDWVQPLSAALASGAEVTRVDLGRGEGWTGRAPGQDGPLRFLTWSPEPGVVFEITTDDQERSIDELVDLADRVDAVDAEIWLDRDGP